MSNIITRCIPNTITCCNLLSGCVASVLALRGETEFATLAIISGAVFDFFDGMSARLLKVSSPIGKELDSLADVVTFGVAPSALLYNFLSTTYGAEYPCAAVPFAAFLMAAFSALRLAKFNLDTRQTTSFIGLPTPANALFWGSLLVSGKTWGIEQMNAWGWILPILLFCWLLVAEIPMFALKFKNLSWADNKVKYLFLVGCIVIIPLLGKGCFAGIIAWYVLLSLLTQRNK